jgi:hypothetical protein
MTAHDPLDRPDAGHAAGIFDEMAAGADESLTDEILMLDRPETEAAEPTVAAAPHAPRRRIIFAAAAVVVLAGCCAMLTGSLSATGSKSPRPLPLAAPLAAAPNQPTPAPAKPTQAGPPTIRPAPHKPAPTRPRVQVAAPGVVHGQPATARHTNTPPKQQRATTGARLNLTRGKSPVSKDVVPNLDAARARLRQVSVIISDLPRDAAAISRILGLPVPPNE